MHSNSPNIRVRVLDHPQHPLISHYVEGVIVNDVLDSNVDAFYLDCDYCSLAKRHGRRLLIDILPGINHVISLSSASSPSLRRLSRIHGVMVQGMKLTIETDPVGELWEIRVLSGRDVIYSQTKRNFEDFSIIKSDLMKTDC